MDAKLATLVPSDTDVKRANSKHQRQMYTVEQECSVGCTRVYAVYLVDFLTP